MIVSMIVSHSIQRPRHSCSHRKPELLSPGTRVALDEVQRLPELFVSIKQAVDEHRAPGRFLLTGSANALLLPGLSDSLAGRMESVRVISLPAVSAVTPARDAPVKVIV